MVKKHKTHFMEKELDLFSPADFGESEAAEAVKTEAIVHKAKVHEAAGYEAEKLAEIAKAAEATDTADTADTVDTTISSAATEQYDLTALFHRLSTSVFRSRFYLNAKDKAYIQEKGLDVIRKHAADFIAKRLAPAVIPNDGKQTPMRHVHPVFQAQHATGCCCRGCFEKWHHIPAGRQLTPAEQAYAVAVIMEWIKRKL